MYVDYENSLLIKIQFVIFSTEGIVRPLEEYKT